MAWACRAAAALSPEATAARNASIVAPWLSANLTSMLPQALEVEAEPCQRPCHVDPSSLGVSERVPVRCDPVR